MFDDKFREFKKLSKLDWDEVVETKDGITTTKEVLYKGNGTEVVLSRVTLDVPKELEELNTKIAELEAKKTILSNVTKE